MAAKVFDGKEYARHRQVGLAIDVYKLIGQGTVPTLASILIGDDPASKLYVSLKEKKAVEVRANMDIYEIGERKGAEYVLKLIKYLNGKPDVQGIMVQMPLPNRLKPFKDEILSAIDPKKDVDSLGGASPFVQPTTKAVLQIINEAKNTGYPNKRKSRTIAAVVGASGMVGKSLVKELEKLYGKVYGVDIKTKNLSSITTRADILISAAGVPNLIEGSMVKKGAIVIDVGAPKGDVDFNEVSKVASFITPVPGGVGPVTIICLLENLVQAALQQTQDTL